MLFQKTAVALGVLALACACTTPQTTSESASPVKTAQVQSDDDAGAKTTDEANAPKPEQASAKDKDRMVCKRYIVTGSRFKKRVCRPWSEWQTISQKSREGLTTLQRRNTQVDVPGGN